MGTAIILRIVLVTTFGLQMLRVTEFGTEHFSTTTKLVLRILFVLTIVVMHFHQRKISKTSGGLILYNGHIIPALNPSDEREKEVNGEAYKIAFSSMFVVSFIVIGLAAVFTLLEQTIQIPAIFFSIAIIPISGLIAFYVSYRHYYSV